MLHIPWETAKQLFFFISNLPTNVFVAALLQVKKTNKQKNETKQIKAKQTNTIFEIDIHGIGGYQL